MSRESPSLFDLLVDVIFPFTFLFLCVSPFSATIMLKQLFYNQIKGPDAARRINALLLIDYFAHGLITMIFLIRGKIYLFLINLPIAIYHIHLVHKKTYMYDVLVIHRRDVIDQKLKYEYAKLTVYLIIFLITLIGFVLPHFFHCSFYSPSFSATAIL